LREQIMVLASLQSLDRKIRDQTEAKEELLKEIREKEQEIETKRADGGTLRAEWETKDKLRQEKEKQLQLDGKRAADQRMRMTQIKNIKEMQALQREIEQIKQANGQLEEEVLTAMTELEGEASILKEKEDELKSLKETWAERRKDFDTQLVEIEQSVAEAIKVRQETAASLNGDLIGRYELIFARCGGMAVVTASAGICEGCHMNIPHQLWNEIIRNDKLNMCPSCHRILYYESSSTEDKQI
jgi:predicted  nucleic acid-binding Zn-ribbon protein